MKIKTFGSVDERSLRQMERCMEAGDAELRRCAELTRSDLGELGGRDVHDPYKD